MQCVLVDGRPVRDHKEMGIVTGKNAQAKLEQPSSLIKIEP